MVDLLFQQPESSAIRVALDDQPMSLINRAREDGIRMQGIQPTDRRLLGEWAARVALGYEGKNSTAGVDHGNEQ